MVVLWQIYHHTTEMVRAHKPTATKRSATPWLVIVLTVVCITGFARLSPELTLAVAISALLALLLFFWSVGHRKGGAEGVGVSNPNDPPG